MKISLFSRCCVVMGIVSSAFSIHSFRRCCSFLPANCANTVNRHEVVIQSSETIATTWPAAAPAGESHSYMILLGTLRLVSQAFQELRCCNTCDWVFNDLASRFVARSWNVGNVADRNLSEGSYYVGEARKNDYVDSNEEEVEDELHPLLR